MSMGRFLVELLSRRVQKDGFNMYELHDKDFEDIANADKYLSRVIFLDFLRSEKEKKTLEFLLSRATHFERDLFDVLDAFIEHTSGATHVFKIDGKLYKVTPLYLALDGATPVEGKIQITPTPPVKTSNGKLMLIGRTFEYNGEYDDEMDTLFETVVSRR